MAASIISYSTKSDLVTTGTAAENKVQASDMNELKTVVNANAAITDTNTADIATNTASIAAIGGAGTGWASYSDTIYTSSVTFDVDAGETLTLPNNAGSVINTYLPSGISAFYDGGTNKITPENVGDAYVVRSSFIAQNDNQNGLFDIELDIGGSQGVILAQTVDFPRGNNTDRFFTGSSLVFTLSTFVTNGGEFKITGITGTTKIHTISYVISRIHKAS